MPDLFDIGEIDARPLGERGLGEPPRDADAQRPGQELEQRPAARRVERIEPAGKQGRGLGGWRRLQRLDDRGEPRRLRAFRPSRPDQRDGLGRVADIIARQVEQHRIDARSKQIGQDAPHREPEEQSVGERCERIAPIRIGRRGEIAGKQAKLVIARRRISQPVEKLRERLHWSSSSRPISASARPLRPVVLM